MNKIIGVILVVIGVAIGVTSCVKGGFTDKFILQAAIDIAGLALICLGGYLTMAKGGK